MDEWRPELTGGASTLYRQLVDALERDIDAGALKQGMRLPPQRVLADRLKLSVGTVTKAYVEAERRGLVAGHVGRGTFIAEPRRVVPDNARDPGGRNRLIDLAYNILPLDAVAGPFVEALGALRRRSDLLDVLTYAPPAGYELHRQAAARFLDLLCGYKADWARLVLTTGAQQAMALAFQAVCSPGDVVLCEEPTFSGMQSIAERVDYRLVGVAIDEQGVIPAALAKAARATSARALYTMPTVQNPTGRTMGFARREEVVRVARKHNLWIVEDDNYAPFAAEHERFAPRLAELAPERTFHVSGLSKSLAAGLRTGFLICPSEALFDRVIRTVRADLYSPPAFGALVFTQWVEDGTAKVVVDAHRREIEARYEYAVKALGERIERLAAPAPHVWLPCGELEAERLAGFALRLGVAVTPPMAPFAAGAKISGLRLCIGAPPTRSELEKGLGVIASALAGVRSPSDLAVV